jgi:hypothetical protein
MPFTDFPNGLTSAADYLSSTNTLKTELQGSVADIGRFVVSGEMDVNLKEVVCSLMAGRGLKLPNLQICISVNLKGLLGDFIGQIQDVLYQALASLDAAFDKFLAHLNLDAVLGRINGILGEITSLANMINFCSAPIDPIQIPNVLENAMDSFLGSGKGIIDSIGTMLPDSIGGCLVFGMGNGGGFTGGIMGDLNNVYDDLITGNLDDALISSIVSDINSVTSSIDTIIKNETNIPTNYSQGGSDLTDPDDPNSGPRTTNTGIGVLYNSSEQGIGGAVSNGSALWSAYQSLGSYQVQDSDGTTYNNIFETFLDPELIGILRRTSNPQPEIATQTPVFSYCGDIIGYTKNTTQQPLQITSDGVVPYPIDQPGFDAGGISTDPANVTPTTVPSTSSTSTTTAPITGISLGGGQDVFKQKVGDQLQFRSITAGENVSLVETATEIQISATANQLVGTTITESVTSSEILFNNNRVTPAINKAWFVTVTAVANRTDASDVTALKLEVLVNNNGGVVSIPSSGGNLTRFNGTAGADDYQILFDVVTNELRVRVQGDIGHTVAWKVKFDFVESP